MSDEPEVSATVPNWSNEAAPFGWNPSHSLLKVLRRYQALRLKGGVLARFRSRCLVPFYWFWSAVAGVDIPLSVRIGGGLLMPHPNGIVIHSDAVIGVNCLLFQQVTLGSGGPKYGAPRLGGHVEVGAGAKVLGGVVIGDHAKIGANAVVLCDVPAGATAVGIPARVILPKGQGPGRPGVVEPANAVG